MDNQENEQRMHFIMQLITVLNVRKGIKNIHVNTGSDCFRIGIGNSPVQIHEHLFITPTTSSKLLGVRVTKERVSTREVKVGMIFFDECFNIFQEVDAVPSVVDLLVQRVRREG